MDHDSFAYPTTLFELLFQQASHANQQGQKRSVKGRAKTRSSYDCSAASPNGLLLVEEDRLFLRIVPPSPGMGFWLPDEINKDFAKVAQELRAAFRGVWDQIPHLDRQQILHYWRTKSIQGAYAEREEVRCFKPLLQIKMKADSPGIILHRLGHHLIFPDSLLTASPDYQSGEIARTLAQVYRFASSLHWKQIMQIIEEPLARWERWMGARATESSREKKLDILDAAYLKAYKKHMTQILCSWGFETAVSAA